MFAIGNVVEFDYDGKVRRVRIEKVAMGYRYLGLIGPVPRLITGWDYCADYPVGGYRTFKVEKIENPVLCRPITL